MGALDVLKSKKFEEWRLEELQAGLLAANDAGTLDLAKFWQQLGISTPSPIQEATALGALEKLYDLGVYERGTNELTGAALSVVGLNPDATLAEVLAVAQSAAEQAKVEREQLLGGIITEVTDAIKAVPAGLGDVKTSPNLSEVIFKAFKKCSPPGGAKKLEPKELEAIKIQLEASREITKEGDIFYPKGFAPGEVARQRQDSIDKAITDWVNALPIDGLVKKDFEAGLRAAATPPLSDPEFKRELNDVIEDGDVVYEDGRYYRFGTEPSSLNRPFDDRRNWTIRQSVRFDQSFDDLQKIFRAADTRVLSAAEEKRTIEDIRTMVQSLQKLAHQLGTVLPPTAVSVISIFEKVISQRNAFLDEVYGYPKNKKEGVAFAAKRKELISKLTKTRMVFYQAFQDVFGVTASNTSLGMPGAFSGGWADIPPADTVDEVEAISPEVEAIAGTWEKLRNSYDELLSVVPARGKVNWRQAKILLKQIINCTEDLIDAGFEFPESAEDCLNEINEWLDEPKLPPSDEIRKNLADLKPGLIAAYDAFVAAHPATGAAVVTEPIKPVPKPPAPYGVTSVREVENKAVITPTRSASGPSVRAAFNFETMPAVDLAVAEAGRKEREVARTAREQLEAGNIEGVAKYAETLPAKQRAELQESVRRFKDLQDVLAKQEALLAGPEPEVDIADLERQLLSLEHRERREDALSGGLTGKEQFLKDYLAKGSKHRWLRRLPVIGSFFGPYSAHMEKLMKERFKNKKVAPTPEETMLKWNERRQTRNTESLQAAQEEILKLREEVVLLHQKSVARSAARAAYDEYERQLEEITAKIELQLPGISGTTMLPRPLSSKRAGKVDVAAVSTHELVDWGTEPSADVGAPPLPDARIGTGPRDAFEDYLLIWPEDERDRLRKGMEREFDDAIRTGKPILIRAFGSEPDLASGERRLIEAYAAMARRRGYVLEAPVIHMDDPGGVDVTVREKGVAAPIEPPPRPRATVETPVNVPASPAPEATPSDAKRWTIELEKFNFHMAFPHWLGEGEALRRIKTLLGELKLEHGDKVIDLREEWNGNEARFSFTYVLKKFGIKVKEFPISGTLIVAPSGAELSGTLSPLAKTFEGVVKSMIRKKAEELLA